MHALCDAPVQLGWNRAASYDGLFELDEKCTHSCRLDDDTNAESAYIVKNHFAAVPKWQPNNVRVQTYTYVVFKCIEV